MKKAISIQEVRQQPILNQLFLVLYRKYKGHDQTKPWTLGELVELSCALGIDLAHEDSDGRTFNNVLHFNEFVIAWDGEEPLDALWYEVNQKLRRRITQYIVVRSA